MNGTESIRSRKALLDRLIAVFGSITTGISSRRNLCSSGDASQNTDRGAEPLYLSGCMCANAYLSTPLFHFWDGETLENCIGI